ncbi:hypothetical protein F4806DRAFT_396234 [Annulohypoxylon nitens]|nr:hypothetical protein F4806DRAFT_396234 [Annulohypoxylon nitens]
MTNIRVAEEAYLPCRPGGKSGNLFFLKRKAKERLNRSTWIHLVRLVFTSTTSVSHYALLADVIRIESRGLLFLLLFELSLGFTYTALASFLACDDCQIFRQRL